MKYIVCIVSDKYITITFSFDTEALNKPYNDTISHPDLENIFQASHHKKIITGIQALYVIGLYDALPVQKILDIFSKLLPSVLFNKLNRYVKADPSRIRSSIHWPTFKSKLDQLNMTLCSQELMSLLSTIDISEKNVKTFHIFQNHLPTKSTEPTLANTTQMISKFLASIYQRNILASLIKYIFLRPLLTVIDTSLLISQKRGIFFHIHKRLNEIVFECVLISFNGANYDNYLLCNSLILIQSRLNQKIKIFKKGASISSILCVNKSNFYFTDQSSKSSSKKIHNNKWLMKLYFKDIRDFFSRNMSLDSVAKLFNLPVSKLVFPYNQATSVKKMKSISSLQPTDETFWKDCFFNKTPLLEARLEAQCIFNCHKFTNLYDFGTYYLIQDCIVLHSILLTLFESYLNQSINIFVRRNYTQSSLSFQQFFIIEPSKQILKQLAPKEINNTFYNYMIKQAVTGGLCTSFVHGKIDDSVTINEHFNYILSKKQGEQKDKHPNLCQKSWPSFFNGIDWSETKPFTEKPGGISTIDIRSLYPSASVKKIPVNTPLFYSRFTMSDYKELFENSNFYNTLDLNRYCNNANQVGNHKTDRFKLISKPPRFYNEFSALSHYLEMFQNNPNINILRFQSGFTALGQLTFDTFPIDGFLSYKDLTTNTIHLKLIQFQSVYFHGHILECPVANDDREKELLKKTIDTTNKIKLLCNHYTSHFESFLNSPFSIEYVEISECQFNHSLPRNNAFLMSYKYSYTYNSFLNNIINKSLTGLIVVKNLQIKKINQNPIFGFIIQKIEYGLKNLSPYTQEQISAFNTGQRVVSVHQNKSFMVMSTEYFNFLYNTFGFEETPEIFHGLFFQLDDYLRTHIESKLILRKELKNCIKNEKNIIIRQTLEIKAELIKLMLNSCYGYTLCNISSKKFKQLENRRKVPSNLKNVDSIIKMEKNVFLVEKTKKYEESFPTLLGHVGCYILFNSKIILLKRLYYLLKFLNPKLSQLLYMDTDSAHFLVKYKNLEENVDPSLRPLFQSLFTKHFENGSTKISGVWVEEGFYECGEYLAEKCYRLYNKSNKIYLTHMKGLNANFQKQFHEQNIDYKKFPYLAYNIFFKAPDFIIFKTHMSKNIFSNFVPNKRYFVSSTGSLPLKL